jgi:small subunit ribosomal protein S6
MGRVAYHGVVKGDQRVEYRPPQQVAEEMACPFSATATSAIFNGLHNLGSHASVAPGKTSPPPASANQRGAGYVQREDCQDMPRPYEAVYVFDSTLEDSAVTEKLDRFHQLLGTSGEMKVDHWGRRQLAYPIGPRENGYYVVARFEAETAGIPEYERALKLDEGVIRYLLTIFEHEVGAPPMTEEELALAKKRGEDDDEDEE